jgi:colanic acid biosynthesis glycosyl transferase WcaI
MTAGNRARRAKVVFVNRYFHPDESATSRMLSDLAFRIARLEISVTVVTSRQLYNDARATLAPYEVVDGVTVHRVATSRYGRAGLVGRAVDYLSFHAAAGAKLFALLAPGDVVVAKTDPPLISIVVSALARWRRARLINWLQDVFPEVATALGMRMIPGFLQSSLVAARDRSLRRADVNIVLGERMKDHLVRRGIDPGRIRIVPNWADTEQVTPIPLEQSSLRRQLGLAGRWVIGYSGNLGRAHEFDTLIGAVRLLRDEPRFAFLITGGGAKLDGLRRAVESECFDNFYFQPYQPPELLADSLAAADIHLVSLLPAVEGLIVPSKLYGILAAGRPTAFIGDTRGEVARVVRDHDCGIAVAVGDSKGLASELRLLLESPSRAREMGRKARSLALARYTRDRAVADWRNILAQVAPDTVGTVGPVTGPLAGDLGPAHNEHS